MRIGIVVFDGADELDFIGPLEILGGVAKAKKDLDAQVRLLSVEPQNEVVAASGLRLRPDGVLGEGEDKTLDLVIVPGGGWVGNAPTGARAEVNRGVLPKKLAALHASGTIVTGVCTGAMLLAAAGLLEGKPAITHHRAIDDLRATRAQVVQARVVDAGSVITCGGVTSSLDLALWLVERFWGAVLADKTAEFLEYTRNRNVYVAEQKTASGGAA